MTDSNELIKSPSDLTIYGKGSIAGKSQSSLLSDMIMGLLRDNYKLEDCTSFYRIAPVSVSGALTPIVSFQCPSGMMGVLKFFGNDAETTDAFKYTTWQIIKNGVPLSDFGAIVTQLGSIASPMPMTERIYDGDIISVNAIVSGGAGTYNLFALLGGWYWGIIS